jgi:hypothetical protein
LTPLPAVGRCDRGGPISKRASAASSTKGSMADAQ